MRFGLVGFGRMGRLIDRMARAGGHAREWIVSPLEDEAIDLQAACIHGADVVFDRVLLVAGGENSSEGSEVRIGAPVVDGVAVNATVLGVHKDRKIIVFKKKRRKKYRRKQGHRQRYTDVRVDSISSGQTISDGQSLSSAQNEG